MLVYLVIAQGWHDTCVVARLDKLSVCPQRHFQSQGLNVWMVMKILSNIWRKDVNLTPRTWPGVCSRSKQTPQEGCWKSSIHERSLIKTLIQSLLIIRLYDESRVIFTTNRLVVTWCRWKAPWELIITEFLALRKVLTRRMTVKE